MFLYLASIIVGLANLIILYVLYKSKDKQGLAFTTILSFTLLWQVTAFLLPLLAANNYSTFWLTLIGRLSYVAATGIFIGLNIFARHFPQSNQERFFKLRDFVLILLTVFILVSPIVIIETSVVDGRYEHYFSPNYIIWAICIGLYFVLTMYAFVKKYLSIKNKVEKKKFQIFLFGILISFLVGITTNLIYPLLTQRSDLSGYGPLGLIFFSGFTTYAILKHQLFEIKTILSQVLFVVMGVLLFSYIWIGETWIEFIGTLFVTLVFAYLAWGIEKQIKEEISQNEVVARSNRKIEEAIESKDIFLRMTSHQLRTPLTSLNGFIEMILEGAKTNFGMNEAAEKDLITVHLNVQRLGIVVNDILAVNALNANRFAVAMREEMDMRQMIESLVSEKKYFFTYYQTEVTVTSKGEGDFVSFIDPVRIRDAVSNVLNNAVFYGKGQVDILVIDNDDGWVEIQVKDNGIGLSQDEEQHVWEQEYRNPQSEQLNPNSTGMGLYVAKQTLKKHHGKIVLKSEGEGKGTTVIIRLLKTQPK